MMNCQTLKFRFIAVSLFLLIMGITFRFGIAVPYTKQQVHDLVANQQMVLASYVARDIGQRIELRRSLIGRLAEELPSVLQQDRFSAWMTERRNASPQFASRILVIDLDGKIIRDSAPEPQTSVAPPITTEPWFQDAIHSNNPVLGRPQREPVHGSPVMLIASAVHDADQNVMAVLAGMFSLGASGLLQGMQDNPIGRTGDLLLISSSDELFVGASNPAKILAPTPPPGLNKLHDKAMSGYRGTGITVNIDGVEELSAIASVPRTDWFVVARMPVAEAFQPVYGLINVALKGTLLALATIVVLVFFVVPRLLRPLTNTAQAMRAIADGKQELLPLPVQRNDEIGSLVLGFNYLVQRLREKEGALKDTEVRLSFLAHHDSLTGLSNRNMLEHRLQQAVDSAQSSRIPFALLFCDLDGFKRINDAHGHKTGDAVLVKLAARFQQGRKPTDTVTRLGGDEFVILLTQLTDARREAAQAAQEYLRAIQQPFEIDGNLFTLSVSIGIVLHNDAATSSSQLLSQADIAMYTAKRQGKNQFQFFEEAAQRTPVIP